MTSLEIVYKQNAKKKKKFKEKKFHSVLARLA